MTIRNLAWMLLLAASCTDASLDDDVTETDQLATLPPPPPPSLGCRGPVFTVVHAANVNAPETWGALTTHVVPNDITINAAVTIGACARVQIAGGRMITIGPNGTVVTQVDAYGNGVQIVPNDFSPWGQIRVLGGSLQLTNAYVGGGGAPVSFQPAGMITLQSFQPYTSRLRVQNVTLAASASLGLNVLAGSIDAASNHLAITGSATAPMSVIADLVGSIPPGTYTGNATDEIVIPATTSKVVAHSQTWYDRGVPYRVGDGTPGFVDVEAPTGVATLTIAPGVTIRFQDQCGLRIQSFQSDTASRGALIAQGTATKWIVFTSAKPTPAPGDWMGIWFNGATDPSSHIQYAAIGYAGHQHSTSQSNGCAFPTTSSINDAAIRIMGRMPPDQWLVENSLIAFSAGHGIDRGWQDKFLGGDEVDFASPEHYNTFSGIAIGQCVQTNPLPTIGSCTPCM